MTAPGRWIACLAVPLFPLAARLRSEPELVEEAAAVVAGDGSAARIVAGTRRARRAGIEPGQTLAQARALVPQLATRPRDPDCERSAREALLEAAEGLSPRIEDGGEGVVYLDVHGLERHFRGAGGGGPATRTGGGATGGPRGRERLDRPPASDRTAVPWQADLGRALIAAAEEVGLPARAGVAASRLAARVAASLPDTPTVVPAGGEAAFLAPLPLGRLSPEVGVAETLERWGIRSIGDLAKLPEAEVASRLGEAGARLHAVARGFDPRPLAPWSPPPCFREGLTLDWPIVHLEPFLFVGRAALERLASRLEARGLACTRLELSLRLEPDGVAERSLDLPAPTRDVKTLLTLVRLHLEAEPPGAPVAGFTLAAHPDRPREAQLSLFGPEALSPDRLATTLARLFALLGPHRAGSPALVDAHRPGRWSLAPYAPPPPPAEPPDPAPPRRNGHGLLAVRVLRPPVHLEVIVEDASEGGETKGGGGSDGGATGESAPRRPISVATPSAETAAGRPAIHGRVKVASGPWSLDEAWWTDEPVERDYWDVELAPTGPQGGGLYRIYRDGATGEWYADGMYD